MLSRPSHLPPLEFFEALAPTAEDPIVILISGCIGGLLCGVDGGTNGDHTQLHRALQRPNVRLLRFCPEDFSFGTPRMTPDIHGGNGFDVLEGNARVLTEDGTDWTDGMVKGAFAMRDLALSEHVRLAILMDMSGACGSTVISFGSRFVTDRRYQKGPGVAAATLIRAGIPVISQRDDRSLMLLKHWLDAEPLASHNAKDHWEKEWYQNYFVGT